MRVITKKRCVIISILVCTLTYAQNEASYWYFGINAGLRFNTATGTVTALTDGQINTLEGCTSISDTDGNLLFYSDGSTVWNRNHQIMPNGTGLKGDDSSTSSGLIVPKPRDPDVYYIFTVDEPHHFNSAAFPGVSENDGINDGLMYSKVNILDAGGLGAVDAVEKNIPLITYDTTNPLHVDFKCSEKITAVKAEDCFSIWVITHFADTFYAFKVNENGVNPTPVTSTVGPYIPVEGYRRNALGYLKASPGGTKLMSANFGESTVFGENAGGSIYLFDFNNETGIVSNALELYSAQNNNSPYGVEFSAENRKVYATIGIGPGGNGQSQILQWNLESADIPNSLQVIHASTFVAGALQLGIDKKIYVAKFSSFLGVIDNPEADAAEVNYNEQGILLDVNGFSQNVSTFGLPPFIQSLFNSQIDIIQSGISTTELSLCTGDNYTLQAVDIQGADYTWTFDGNSLTETSSQLVVDTAGFYEVFIEPNNGGCEIEGSAVVSVYDIPIAHQPTDVRECDTANNNGTFSFDFTSKNSEVLQLQDPTQYNVRYFETLNAANNLKSEITFPYLNTSNPQTLYVRVDHVENTNCFAINFFEIEIFNIPQVVLVEDIEFCDDEGDATDGIATTNLSDSIPGIIGEQEATAVNVSFHASQSHADDNKDPLSLMHTNTNPFNETVYVRIENANNTDCYDTARFDIIIKSLPRANNVILLQCDEDGISDGLTVFNINQVEDDITGNDLNVEVLYYTSLQDAQNGDSPINAGAFENDENPQTIYTRVTNPLTGCVNFSEVTLQVSTTTSNNASIQICDDDGSEDGFASFNISSVNATLLLGAPIGSTPSYYETYSDALLETNPLGDTFTNTDSYNQIIYARIENNNACFGISEITLTVLELPEVETTYETLYCLNHFPETILLDGGIINGSPSDYFYQWSTGENTATIEVNAPGMYTVRVSNANGCFKERVITVLPSNIATITGVDIRDASQNNSISISVSGEGDYEYALNNVNGPYQNSPVFNNVKPGIYTVYVRDKNNCGIVEDEISVIGFPKFFTPNGDGINDYWQVYGISSQFQPESIIFIFNREGKVVASIDPIGAGWDGTYNGNKLPTADYWFKVTLQDGRTLTGHFALKQ